MQAGPRTARGTCRLWDILSDDTLYYRSDHIAYIALEPVDIKLNGNKKLCHWGCLNEDGEHTLLSSSEYDSPARNGF